MDIIRNRPYLVACLIGGIVPGLLLGTAIGMQHALNLVPCHMCLEQRLALRIAMALAIAGLILSRTFVHRILTISSGVAVAACASIAIHQAGGERHWWVLNTPCATNLPKGGNALDNIMKMPFVRCDVPQWSYAGLTMADLNAIACVSTTLVMLALIVKGEKRRRNPQPKAPALPTAEEK